MEYAILDIETTGGKYNEEGITEIAIYKFDGQQVSDQFISLVNPEKPIQDFVVKLTGINNKMLRNAPKFFEVAKRIIEITKDCVLVAHNAKFDSRILKTEFDRLGFNFEKNTLCTVELSRKLIPDQKSYSLGKLCKSLGIPMSDRHRASGDALATIQLFKLLLKKDTEKTIIKQSINYFDNREIKDKLNKLIDKAPESEGLFYIHNPEGNVIFLGRGRNMKSELSKLFVKESKRSKKIQERVFDVTFEETGNELFTRLKYKLELEKLNPKYNIRKSKSTKVVDFGSDNFILIHKGRMVEEKAIILVEDNTVCGYGYTNLSFQNSQIDILKNVLTPIENQEQIKGIIKGYLSKNKVLELVRF